jgi:hypothetical protein
MVDDVWCCCSWKVQERQPQLPSGRRAKTQAQASPPKEVSGSKTSIVFVPRPHIVNAISGSHSSPPITTTQIPRPRHSTTAMPQAQPELKKVSRDSIRLDHNPNLAKYLDKRLFVQLNGSRKVIGVLRGYDVCDPPAYASHYPYTLGGC